MEKQDKLIDSLKQNGYSLTKPRQALFSALQAGKPRSMRELTLDLASVMDRASIYRTVELYEKLGIVTRVQQGWKYKIELSDKFSPHHHHITCTECNRVVSFDEPSGINEAFDDIAHKKGFVQKRHSLEIEGICSDCQSINQTLTESGHDI